MSAGVTAYADGADKVAFGAQDYVAGVGQLDAGIDTLASSAGTLVAGVDSVNEGAQKLSEGAAALPDEKTAQALKAAGTAVTEGVGTIHDSVSALCDVFNRRPKTATVRPRWLNLCRSQCQRFCKTILSFCSC